MMIPPIKFNANPVLAIRGIVRYPLPNTIALPGVATGSMKAHEAEMAAGAMSKMGLIPSATAVVASMGIIIVVMAVLDVISVRNVIIKQTEMIRKSGGK